MEQGGKVFIKGSFPCDSSNFNGTGVKWNWNEVDSSFQFHLTSAKNNGITKEEISEILTHAVFYVGWSKAWVAFRMAKEVWAEEVPADSAKEAYEKICCFQLESQMTDLRDILQGKAT